MYFGNQTAQQTLQQWFQQLHKPYTVEHKPVAVLVGKSGVGKSYLNIYQLFLNWSKIHLKIKGMNIKPLKIISGKKK